MSKKLYLLDGTALLYRAFFGLQRTGLTAPGGQPAGAVFGFANTLQFLVTQEKPDYLGVVFDAPGPTFRHEMYPEYKAHRAEMPEDMVSQIPLVSELVDAWPCARVIMPGVEADDVIGSYAAQLAGPELEVIMVTGDKDFYQLLSEQVRILNPGRGGAAAVEARVIGPDDIPEKFGVTEPRQVVDVLALMGDTSDNVPGIPGVGPKTAGKLIAEYGSIEGIYRNLDQLKPGLRGKLEAHRETAERARELVTIKTDLDLPLSLEELAARPPGGDALASFLERMGFRRLLQELGGTPGRPATPADLFAARAGYELVTDEKALSVLAKRLAGCAEGFAVDTETTSVDPMRAELVGIALAAAPGEAWYVNTGHRLGADPVPVAAVRKILGPVLADPGLPKVFHHAKYDLLVLARAGLPVDGVAFDTMIASYLLDPEGSHKLDNLARLLLGETMIPITDLIGKGGKQKSMAEVDAASACRYAAEDADMTLRLRADLAPKLEASELSTLFSEVEMPLMRVLMKMERVGVALDTAFLAGMSERLDREMTRLVSLCHELADTEFNVNSPRQLADVLFVRLDLPHGRRTKTGYSTDSEVLEGLRPLHALPGAILDYRQAAKLKSTYVDTLPEMIHPQTGRVHASFNQTVAATGRLSSSDPNLQNIPIRTPLGREVRRAFVPGEPGWVLMSADYSQIELRIMAHLSGDPALTAAFAAGTDVHRDTAARVFGVDPEEVTELQRGQAKTVNFGVLYGQGPYGLARTLGISTGEATEFIRAYKAQYAGVVGFLDRSLVEARERGYVTTLLGRRRPIPSLAAKSAAARAAAERLAINTPIQGSAADLIKVAMVNLDRRLAETGMKGRLLMQVHDELVLECPEAEAAELGTLVRETMEGALTLSVPVVVNIGVGANWAEIH
jgi:DNA polymerase-1